MCRAASAAFDRLRARWPEVRTISVFCGAGNNGGDGYVLARLALEAGFDVQLIALKAPADLSGDALRAAQDWLQAGGTVDEAEASIHGALLVDALLGTGLDRAPSGPYAELIDRINAHPAPVLSLDLPSGLNADTGQAPGACVRAELTVTFIALKRGLFTGGAGAFTGQLLLDALDVPETLAEDLPADARLLEAAELARCLPSRPCHTHKGETGHVLVIGGDLGMSGAPVLSGQAALRTGSGLVSLATRGATAAAALAVQPELMVHSVDNPDALKARIGAADVLALGPGLGRSDWSQAMWSEAMKSARPMVLDADGLYWLAQRPRERQQLIITPHPGEAAMLLGTTSQAIQADRFQAVRSLADRYSAVAVLKGWGSLVATPDGQVEVCPFGNPAMASAGMGDALTGIIASLLGQGLAAFDAARVGVLAHALAGDRAARGRRQILASDLITALAEVLPA